MNLVEEDVEEVEDFRYLDSQIATYGKSLKDFKQRIAQGKQAF